MSLKKDRQRTQEEQKTKLNLCHKMAASLYNECTKSDLWVNESTEIIGTYLAIIIARTEGIGEALTQQQFINGYLLDVENVALRLLTPSNISNIKETTCH